MALNNFKCYYLMPLYFKGIWPELNALSRIDSNR